MVNEMEFNKYCADVLGYTDFDLDLFYDRLYDPYNNLNHITDAVETLLEQHAPKGSIGGAIRRHGVKQAFRNFIISTMPEDVIS